MCSTDAISEETIREIARHYEAIITLLGEDVTREGLAKTPMRAAKAMVYATRGYRQDADMLINGAIFTHEGSNMVIVRDIEFYSLCEHHILPFFGKVSIGYIPRRAHYRSKQTCTSRRFLRTSSAGAGATARPDM